MGFFGYWLQATGYWQRNDRMKLSSFSVSCQKPETRVRLPVTTVICELTEKATFLILYN
jgi:hypothetical protein